MQPAPLQRVVPEETLRRLCGAFRTPPGRTHGRAFRPYVYRSQYLVPVVVNACQALGISNLYLKRTQVYVLRLLHARSTRLCDYFASVLSSNSRAAEPFVSGAHDAMQLLTSALDLASGENPFCPVKYGSYTPLLRIPQGLQNAADIDRWISVLRSNMQHTDRCDLQALQALLRGSMKSASLCASDSCHKI